jgi:LmbE family N-acetylglucosaminyl deacetylase
MNLNALLSDPEMLPLLGIEELLTGINSVDREFNPSKISPSQLHLFVAPHSDDETLGCGGAIALLRQLNLPVAILIISDGTKSHPNSLKYPAPALKKLREQESLAALAILGVEAEAITFFGLPDSAVPTPEVPEYEAAIARCRDYLLHLSPTTIYLPWRGDPHRDHRATWKLINDASKNLPDCPCLIEYPIWSWNLQKQNQIAESVTAWRLDTSAVVEQKQEAIAQYRSQITNLIDDDPEGFCLAPEMLENFTRPWEVYLEVR